ncbi:SAM-dependent methyltransferase [Sphaerisporangium viridialbum]|uniref:SAM-dependent methyltransferase n=1 Tax=Sphaerisporangium viridialbum TaxID=46189 RepID=UPI003C75A4AC
MSGRRYAKQTAEERLADQRQRLIGAAHDLFGNVGFNNTRVVDLTAQAAVSSRTFYECFPDRQHGRLELLKLVYDRCAQDAIDAVRDAVSRLGADPQDWTRVAVEAYVRFVTGDPRRARILYREAAQGGEYLRQSREWTATHLAALLGDTDHPQGDLVAKGVVAALEGLLADGDHTSTADITAAAMHIAGRAFDEWEHTMTDGPALDQWRPPVSEPTQIDTRVPSTARMYDYMLGGKDNYAADRGAVHRLVEMMPEAPDLAEANRAFMVRTVGFCATAVSQFIDLGTGIPTSPNVDEVARQVNPEAVVVGVDIDPVVLSHGRALRAGVHIVDGDVRDPEKVIRQLAEVIDFAEPVTLIATSLLNFIPDDPGSIVRVFRAVMAPGSLLVVSHGTDEGAPPETVTRFREVYAKAASPAVFRRIADIKAIFDGFTLLDPGLVDVQQWRPDGIAQPVLGIRMLGAVARVPQPPRVLDGRPALTGELVLA